MQRQQAWRGRLPGGLTSSFFDRLRCRKSPDRGFWTLWSHWSSWFVSFRIVRHVFENFWSINNNDPLEARLGDVAQERGEILYHLLCYVFTVHYYFLVIICILNLKVSLNYVFTNWSFFLSTLNWKLANISKIQAFFHFQIKLVS